MSGPSQDFPLGLHTGNDRLISGNERLIIIGNERLIIGLGIAIDSVNTSRNSAAPLPKTRARELVKYCFIKPCNNIAVQSNYSKVNIC